MSPRPFKKRPIWPHWLPWNFEVSRITKGIVIGRTLCKPHTTFNKSTPRWHYNSNNADIGNSINKIECIKLSIPQKSSSFSNFLINKVQKWPIFFSSKILKKFYYMFLIGIIIKSRIRESFELNIMWIYWNIK